MFLINDLISSIMSVTKQQQQQHNQQQKYQRRQHHYNQRQQQRNQQQQQQQQQKRESIHIFRYRYLSLSFDVSIIVAVFLSVLTVRLFTIL